MAGGRRVGKLVGAMMEFGRQAVYYAVAFVGGFFQSRSHAAMEILALRSQLALCRHRIEMKKHPKPRPPLAFRWLWVIMCKTWGGWQGAACLMKPATVLKWHRTAFRLHWRWKSRKRGRPAISARTIALIRRLSRENQLWSAERIHNHLVLLGYNPPHPDTIRRYMIRSNRRGGKSQSWLTFLRNHTGESWGMDFFTVPTLTFRSLYVFVVLNHARRQVVYFNVTEHPTSAWVTRQLGEAMPFDVRPRFLFRDNDGIYGRAVPDFLKSHGVGEIRNAYRSPWQNPFVERFIGTLRRELLDHVIVINDQQLRRLLREFIDGYYHCARPHQGLGGGVPLQDEDNGAGPILVRPANDPEGDQLLAFPVVGGLHHRYVRLAA